MRCGLRSCQGIGLEFPAPDCVGKPVTINGTKFEVVSPAGAHLCVGEDRGSVVVSAYPAVAMPYLMTSVPKVDGMTTQTEITLSTSALIAFAGTLGLLGKNSKTGVFPGAKASYTFKGTPGSIAFNLEQYPVLLLMVILAKTLDTLGIATIDRLDDLQCLVDVAGTESALRDRIDGEGVGSFARSFFSCAGTVAGPQPRPALHSCRTRHGARPVGHLSARHHQRSDGTGPPARRGIRDAAAIDRPTGPQQ